MTLKFFKYQGSGNDFVIMDNRKDEINLTTSQIMLLCDRRFGIGGDGLMLLNKHTDYDFEMKYYNSDGKESTMCGNGGRCLTKFAYDQGILQTTYHFLAIDGPHKASINSDGTVALKMNDVTEISCYHGDIMLNTGSPHYIKMVSDVMHYDVFKNGREIRYSKDFANEGINVNFVEQLDEDDQIIVRTYERGVEDETLSCGTGVTAAAIVCCHNDNGFNHINIKTRGGNLSVEYEKNGNHYTNVWLIGPALKVFEGIIEV
ncbi:MAG: diaminopimelate epimerase [Chitinophagaceae bacterium]